MVSLFLNVPFKVNLKFRNQEISIFLARFVYYHFFLSISIDFAFLKVKSNALYAFFRRTYLPPLKSDTEVQFLKTVMHTKKIL